MADRSARQVLELVLPQLRFGYSMMTGRQFDLRSLDRLVDAVIETRREFGFIGPDSAEMLGGPRMDPSTQRDMQLRRFRTAARRGAEETRYYESVFQELQLSPGDLTLEDIALIPTTPKLALRDRPADFVRRHVTPAFRTTTTGTTGKPTSTYFTHNEMQVTSLLNAMTFVQRGTLGPDDIVQISTSSRATLGNTCFQRGCERLGAVWFQAGLIEPEIAIALLTEEHRLPGKRRRVSFLNVYPSYLGMIVEHGLRAGLGPTDFGLDRISVGGEVVTQGLKSRSRKLFGDVQFTEGFGMTETWPFGGTRCEQGHLHFEAPQGLLEVLDLDEPVPAEPGQLGTMVSTPFPPFRDAGVVLRYDTQDLVHQLKGPLDCSLAHVPACSDVQGKLRLAIRHDSGWTTPRDVMEALEGIELIPLPARFGFWPLNGGVAVEVVALGDSSAARRWIGDSLEAYRVPLRELHVHGDASQLERPYPLRGDLREIMFGRP